MSDPLDPTRPLVEPGQAPGYPGQAPQGPTQPTPGWTPPAAPAAPGWTSPPAPGWTPPTQPGWSPQPQGWSPPQPQGWTPPPGQYPPGQYPPTQGWNQPGGQYGYGGWQAPPRQSSRAPLVIGIVVAIVVSLVIIVALAMLGSSLGTFMEGSSLNDIAVGQCFNGGRASDSGETTLVSTVTVVDCAEAHESELIANFEYAGPETGGSYPNVADLTAYSESECSARFGQYVGVTFNESAFEMTYVYPLSTGWLIGDRGMQCVAHPPIGQSTMTGTVRGARR